MNIQERLNALIERRGVILEDVKFRGTLQVSNPLVYEAAQKQHVLKSFFRNIIVL